MTTNALQLNERLSKSANDWLRVAVTTNVAADRLIISTSLNEHDGGRDGYFEDWWVHIGDFLNAGVERRVRNYYTANATCNVFGAVFTADAVNASTIRLGRYSYGEKQIAINAALEELYPILHKKVEDKSLATNSVLYEYPIPSTFNQGDIYGVQVNTYRSAASAADEQEWREIYNWTIMNEGNTLRIPELFASDYLMKIYGTVPMETVEATTDVVNIDDPDHLRLLTAYAKYKLYDNKAAGVSSEDQIRYERETAKAYAEYKRLLPKSRMSTPRKSLITPRY